MAPSLQSAYTTTTTPGRSFNGHHVELHLSKREPSANTRRLPTICLGTGHERRKTFLVVPAGTHKNQIKGLGSLFRDVSRRRFLVDDQARRVKLDDVPGGTVSLFSNLPVRLE